MRVFFMTFLALLVCASGAQAGTSHVHCTADNPLVWVNTDTHVYHFKDSRYYGHTAHGEYMCQRSAVARHDHAAKGAQQ